jgi:hypothetical protein
MQSARRGKPEQENCLADPPNPWDAILSRNIDVDAPDIENPTKLRRQALANQKAEPFRKDITGVYPDMCARLGSDYLTHDAPLRTQTSSISSFWSAYGDEESGDEFTGSRGQSGVSLPQMANEHPLLSLETSQAQKIFKAADETISTKTNTNPKIAHSQRPELTITNQEQNDKLNDKPQQVFLAKNHAKGVNSNIKKNIDPMTPEKPNVSSAGSSQANKRVKPKSSCKSEEFQDQSMFFEKGKNSSMEKRKKVESLEQDLEEISAIKKRVEKRRAKEEEGSRERDSDLKQLHDYLSKLSGGKLPPFKQQGSEQAIEDLSLELHESGDFDIQVIDEKYAIPVLCATIVEAKYSYEERSDLEAPKPGAVSNSVDKRGHGNNSNKSEEEAKEHSDHVTNLGRIDEESAIDNQELQWNPARWAIDDQIVGDRGQQLENKDQDRPGDLLNLERPVDYRNSNQKTVIEVPKDIDKVSNSSMDLRSDTYNGNPAVSSDVLTFGKPNPISSEDREALKKQVDSNFISNLAASSKEITISSKQSSTRIVENLKKVYIKQSKQAINPSKVGTEMPLVTREESPDGIFKVYSDSPTESNQYYCQTVSEGLIAEKNTPEGKIMLKPDPSSSGTQNYPRYTYKIKPPSSSSNSSASFSSRLLPESTTTSNGTYGEKGSSNGLKLGATVKTTGTLKQYNKVVPVTREQLAVIFSRKRVEKALVPLLGESEKVKRSPNFLGSSLFPPAYSSSGRGATGVPRTLTQEMNLRFDMNRDWE